VILSVAKFRPGHVTMTFAALIFIVRGLTDRPGSLYINHQQIHCHSDTRATLGLGLLEEFGLYLNKLPSVALRTVTLSNQRQYIE
jgi:hypothetical protein